MIASAVVRQVESGHRLLETTDQLVVRQVGPVVADQRVEPDVVFVCEPVFTGLEQFGRLLLGHVSLHLSSYLPHRCAGEVLHVDSFLGATNALRCPHRTLTLTASAVPNNASRLVDRTQLAELGGLVA